MIITQFILFTIKNTICIKFTPFIIFWGWHSSGWPWLPVYLPSACQSKKSPDYSTLSICHLPNPKPTREHPKPSSCYQNNLQHKSVTSILSVGKISHSPTIPSSLCFQTTCPIFQNLHHGFRTQHFPNALYRNSFFSFYKHKNK